MPGFDRSIRMRKNHLASLSKRIVVIITDSVGAGGAPDADRFGDAGADTLKHIDEAVPGGIKVPSQPQPVFSVKVSSSSCGKAS